MDRSEWVLVPREPTEAMLAATDCAERLARVTWAKMIAAAPPPPAEQASGEYADLIRNALHGVYAAGGITYPQFTGALDFLAALSQRPVVDEGMQEPKS